RSPEELETIHAKVLEVMNNLKTRFKGKSPGSIACCIGDTPSSSMMDHFEGIDELSPGNYVFYDLMQYRIGSCDFSDIAVALAAPVVAKHPARQEVILHCGAVHLSKERIDWEGRDCYGLPVRLSGSAWSDPVEGGYLRTISQEHGVLACSESFFDSLDIGELVGILPVHSCLTADLMRGYRLHSDGTALSHMKSA
ncbi:MAG: hypothetical protein R3224_08320, partial [Balneolaceae bacterium]|nr:hypothetical protein [Balneolaceae bacterium]